ncbi:hypothetical protein [Spartinivicinus ruber]|uniref:hypothetical protein n=1 Tax=Spartinivicinus ruber TaxID=2683272 RepID=UPI0013D69BAF|nr:hypothetical protein [Spartinivicinus ruber]
MLDTNTINIPTTAVSHAAVDSVNSEAAKVASGQVKFEASENLQAAKKTAHNLDKPVRPADPSVANNIKEVVAIDRIAADILKTPTDKEVAGGALDTIANATNEINKKFPGLTPENSLSIISNGSGQLSFTAIMLHVFKAFQQLQKSTREDRLDEFNNAIQSLLTQAKTMKDGAWLQLGLALGGAVISAAANGFGMKKLGPTLKFMKESPFGNSSNAGLQQFLQTTTQRVSMQQGFGDGIGKAVGTSSQSVQNNTDAQRTEEQAVQQREQANSEHSNDIRKSTTQAIMELIQQVKSDSEREDQMTRGILGKMV